MKILMLTIATGACEDVAKISSPNKFDYAKRHGYDFEEVTELPSLRPPAWNKIPVIKNRLPKYDWVFWTDCDSLIMNEEVTLESFIDPEMTAIFSNDVSGLNSGQFFIKNCQQAFDLLDKVWAHDEYTDHSWWEQAAIHHVLAEHPEFKVKLVDQNLFNSYHSTYRQGDFMIHWAGFSVGYYLKEMDLVAQGAHELCSRPRRT